MTSQYHRWYFSHNFTDAGAMVQSCYKTDSDPSLRLNVFDDDGDAFLFWNDTFIAQIPTSLERKS